MATTRKITEHEVRTEHKLIQEFVQTYVTIDGEERLWKNVPSDVHHPGTLNEDTYVKTDLKALNADVKVLASHFWTQDVHDLFEALLKEQAAEVNNL